MIKRIAAFLFGMLLCLPAQAQQSSLLNVVLENQVAGDYPSADQQNIQPTQSVSLMCVFNMSNYSGVTPIVSYKIQGKVGNVEQYFTLLESVTVNKIDTPVVLVLGPGIENAAKLNKALPVPPTWRIVLSIKGAGTSVTGLLACRVQ